jgi:hypothetical protein
MEGTPSGRHHLLTDETTKWKQVLQDPNMKVLRLTARKMMDALYWLKPVGRTNEEDITDISPSRSFGRKSSI